MFTSELTEEKQTAYEKFRLFLIAPITDNHQQSSRKSVRVYRTEPYKMIKMYLKIQDIFTRPNEFLPDMSGGQTEFREDCTNSWVSDHTLYCGYSITTGLDETF